MTSIDRARRGLLGALIVLPVLLAACIQGQGPVTNETRDPGPFTRLKVGASDDFTSSQPVTVTVSTPSLEAISMSGGARAQVS
jgi:hypothetical protein